MTAPARCPERACPTRWRHGTNRPCHDHTHGTDLSPRTIAELLRHLSRKATP